MDCIFCKIVAGDIPAYKVYEDDDVLAFLDIAPTNPGHTLVIPKKHYSNLLDLPVAEAQKLISAVKKIAPAILAGAGAESFNLNLNSGEAAGQLVAHVHWHLVPRFAGDGLELWHGVNYPAGEAEKVLEKIRSKI